MKRTTLSSYPKTRLARSPATGILGKNPSQATGLTVFGIADKNATQASPLKNFHNQNTSMNCTLKILAVALAGGLGTLARYGLSSLVQHFWKGQLPWGTIAVNLLGCFAFGLIWASLSGRLWFTHEWRTILFVGFMGAFTTFSSYIFETGELINTHQWLAMTGNLALQNGIGLAAFFGGIFLGRMV